MSADTYFRAQVCAKVNRTVGALPVYLCTKNGVKNMHFLPVKNSEELSKVKHFLVNGIVNFFTGKKMNNFLSNSILWVYNTYYH